MAKYKFLLLLCFQVLLLSTTSTKAQYQPNWPSIDSRPLPKWYDESKFGIFIHWGVFSVPSFHSEWFWNQWKSGYPDYIKFMKDQYPPSFTYQDFAKDFDAYLYDPDWWADLIQDAGAKYVVLTAKHHEGFDNWPSNVSFSWNSMDVGPNKDLVGMLMESIRSRTGVHFGIYHSQFEWYNPLFLMDQENQFKTRDFPTSKTLPELYELVNRYNPEIVWSDGNDLGDDAYWNATGFIAWLYNESPVRDTVVTNDRWAADTDCTHGGFWTCGDRNNPGHLLPHKWENCFTLDTQSWGYRREGVLSDYLSDLQVVSVLAETVSCGGNLLLNVGPRKDGRIDPLMEERLRNVGKWLRINGEAIYGTQPWLFQNETNYPVWYTAKQTSPGSTTKSNATTVYAIVLQWPTDDQLFLENVKPSQNLIISMLGYELRTLPWKPMADGILLYLSGIKFSDMPSTVAWVLRIDGLSLDQQQIHPIVKQFYKYM